MLTLEDIGLTTDSSPEVVRASCDEIARRLASLYEAGTLSWFAADAIANNIYELMILHCGDRVPDYAWDVFLAFDESEIDNRGDSFARARIAELNAKYGAS
jgi:hypothetical protein